MSRADSAGFFTDSLMERDPEIQRAIDSEAERQRNEIELIASENIVSRAVLEAVGSVMTNKYAEGYPGRRYYSGCEHVDIAETLAVERAKTLFDVGHVNVQPHSGAQANEAVYLALLEPGDTFMGMALDQGGHLTHGSRANMSGKWFNPVHYGVRREDGIIDYDAAEVLARETSPRLIIAGASAYPRIIDFPRFRAIADSVGAMLLVDMAHIAGLVAAGVHPSPIPHADVVTFTTHKTLRGPRGGAIACKDPALGKKIDSAVFPGYQGGPLMHVIAGKAVAFREALQPEFKIYAQQVVDSACALAAALEENGVDIVSGGTDTHLVLVDLRRVGVTGRDAEEALNRCGLTCNKNSVPFDEAGPRVTSGVRLGSAAATSRGFGPDQFREVGNLVAGVIKALAGSEDAKTGDATIEAATRARVAELCAAFPVYPTLSAA